MQTNSYKIARWVVLICFILVIVYWVAPLNQTTHSVCKSPSNAESDLVVAFCREDLTWIYKVAKRFRYVFIYTKCGRCVENTVILQQLCVAYDNVRIVPLPNIGSCDYVYLTHIIAEYRDLPTAIEFHVGSGDRKRRSIHYSFHRIHVWDFKLDHWKFTNHSHMAYHKSPYDNLLHYSTSVLGEVTTSRLKTHAQYLYYGGVFMATRDEIQKHPIEVYEQLRSTQHYANEEVDHFIERLWGPLFTCT
jgi:hypothetical protein